MSEYHCNKHNQIKIKKDGKWICPHCEKNDPLSFFTDIFGLNKKDQRK